MKIYTYSEIIKKKCPSAAEISTSARTRLFGRFLATDSLLPAVTAGGLQRALKPHRSCSAPESDQVDNLILVNSSNPDITDITAIVIIIIVMFSYVILMYLSMTTLACIELPQL